MEILCDGQNVKLSHCFADSFCLSADVSNAFDPNFAETCDRRNNSMLNYGVSICKYTGSRGKGGASDASAEAMQHVRSTLDAAGVKWQIATLGKVDQGGGGARLVPVVRLRLSSNCADKARGISWNYLVGGGAAGGHGVAGRQCGGLCV